MQSDIAERDWKVFKELHPIAMDRFFEKTVKDLQQPLWTKNKPAQERFWDAWTYATRQQEQTAILFDDFRRSTAILQARMIHANHLYSDEEVARFSPEMRDRLRAFVEMTR